MKEVREAPLWDNSGYCPSWLADRKAFSVCIVQERFDFAPSPQDYEHTGIIFANERTGPNTINPGQLLRFASVTLHHPFFRSEDELRALIQPSLLPQMSLFLQTGWWQHPEPLIGANTPNPKDHWIENIPCWQLLTRAIVSGHLSEWNAQDTSGFNTDWASLDRIYREGNFGYGFDD